MSEKLLSVLMPIYNDEKYLGETLDSVFAAVSQENEPYVEFIFIDDGSTDRTAEILQKMQQKYKFQYISRENKGAMATSNELLYLAAGKYIFMIDHDDILPKNAIDKIIAYLRANPDVEMLFCDHESFLEGCNNVEYHQNGWDFAKKDGQTVYALLVKRDKLHNPLWEKVFSRECAIKNEIFFNEKLTFGDFEYTPRLMSYIKKVGYMPEAVYKWRMFDTSLSHGMMDNNKQFGVLAMQAAEALLNFANKSSHLTKEFVESLHMSLSDYYWGAYKDVILTDGYNNMLAETLERHKPLMKYSRKWNRKYIYRPLVYLLGVKLFCKLRYGK